MNKKRTLKERLAGLVSPITTSAKKFGTKGKLIELIAIVALASVVHELGHIIVGGGVRDFRYPGPDMLSTVVVVRHGTLLSEMSGFLFTLPLLLVSTFPRLLLLILVFQSRYDFLDVLSQLKIIHVSLPPM